MICICYAFAMHVHLVLTIDQCDHLFYIIVGVILVGGTCVSLPFVSFVWSFNGSLQL
jgi:hypothetical protein